MKIRRQSPIKGGRSKMSPCVMKEIESAIRYAAREYGVSKSWVVSVLLADMLGIKEQPDFRMVERPKLRRVR